MLPAQCRAARALLDWSQQDLASSAGVGIVTVRQFEAGATSPRNATTELLMNTLEAEGIEFLAGNGAGPGLRLKTLGVSRENFLTFLKLYERNRLGAKARYATPLPHFGYTFAFRSDGADLLFHGQLLGSVRWNEGMVIFDPPLPPPGQDEPLSDQAFDIWVSRAEYRNATGI